MFFLFSFFFFLFFFSFSFLGEEQKLKRGNTGGARSMTMSIVENPASLPAEQGGRSEISRRSARTVNETPVERVAWIVDRR